MGYARSNAMVVAIAEYSKDRTEELVLREHVGVVRELPGQLDPRDRPPRLQRRDDAMMTSGSTKRNDQESRRCEERVRHRLGGGARAPISPRRRTTSGTTTPPTRGRRSGRSALGDGQEDAVPLLALGVGGELAAEGPLVHPPRRATAAGSPPSPTARRSLVVRLGLLRVLPDQPLHRLHRRHVRHPLRDDLAISGW